MSYINKYFKYKIKYLNHKYKNQYGGANGALMAKHTKETIDDPNVRANNTATIDNTLNKALMPNASIDVIRSLINNANAQPVNDSTQYNTLNKAIRAHMPTKIIKLLIEEAGAQPVDEEDGNTLNIAIVSNASIDTIKALVNIARAQPVNYDPSYNTLNEAIQADLSAKIIELLIEEVGAQPVNDSTQYNTLNKAFRSHLPTKIIELLIEEAGAQPINEEDDDNTLNIAIVSNASIDTIKALVNIAGARPANYDPSYNTLNKAIQAHMPTNIIELLIEKAGAQPVNEYGDNTLNIATVSNASIDTIKALVNIAGAQPVNDSTQYNTLNKAIQAHMPAEIIELLIEKAGAQPVNSEYGDNTLNIAIISNASIDTIKALVNIAGARPANYIPSYNTLNYTLQMKTHPDIMKFLIDVAEAQPENGSSLDNTLNMAIRTGATADEISFLTHKSDARPDIDTLKTIFNRENIPYEILDILIAHYNIEPITEAPMNDIESYNANKKYDEANTLNMVVYKKIHPPTDVFALYDYLISGKSFSISSIYELFCNNLLDNKFIYDLKKDLSRGKFDGLLKIINKNIIFEINFGFNQNNHTIFPIYAKVLLECHIDARKKNPDMVIPFVNNRDPNRYSEYKENGEVIGRTIFTLKGGMSYMEAIKLKKKNESLETLIYEKNMINWLATNMPYEFDYLCRDKPSDIYNKSDNILDMYAKYQSELQQNIKNSGNAYEIDIDKLNYIIYNICPSASNPAVEKFYKYLEDCVDGDGCNIVASTKKGLIQCGKLLSRGLVHTSLVALYHNIKDGRIWRVNADVYRKMIWKGRYGTGKMSQVFTVSKFSNFRWLGLADFAEIKTLDEYGKIFGGNPLNKAHYEPSIIESAERIKHANPDKLVELEAMTSMFISWCIVFFRNVFINKKQWTNKQDIMIIREALITYIESYLFNDPAGTNYDKVAKFLIAINITEDKWECAERQIKFFMERGLPYVDALVRCDQKMFRELYNMDYGNLESFTETVIGFGVNPSHIPVQFDQGDAQTMASVEKMKNGANILLLILYGEKLYPIYIGWNAHVMSLDVEKLNNLCSSNEFIRENFTITEIRPTIADYRAIDATVYINVKSDGHELILNPEFLDRAKWEFRNVFYEYIDLGPFNGTFPLIDLLLIIQKASASSILIKNNINQLPKDENEWIKYLSDGIIEQEQ